MQSYLQDRMKRFFAAIALALLHTNCLCGAIVLDPIKMYVEAGDLLETFVSLHKLCVAQQLDMACYLEVVLLLADKSIIRIRKVKTFICIHPVMRNRSANTL